jgi:RNA polymerase sigma-70 factor, ECF subfamily
MTTKEELKLIVLAKKGEKEALGTLWDAITPKLYGYLVNTLRDKHLADDILQETWIKAIEKIDKFKPRNVRFSAWLFAIARNECRQHWRKKKDYRFIDEMDASLPNLSKTYKDDSLMVDQLLHNLKKNEQELIRLRYIAELSFKEIAQVLSISSVTARVRVHRILQKIRTKIEK